VGSNLTYTRSRGEDIDRFLRSRPEVAYTYLSVGADAQQNVNKGTIFVQLTPKRERRLNQQQIETQLRATFRDLKGVKAYVEQQGMGGSQAPIQVNVLGPDLARLQDLSDRALALSAKARGAVEMRSSLEGRRPEFVVDINRDLAANLGLTIGGVANSLRTLLSGTDATTYEDETGLEHNIVVRVADEYRTSVQDLARVPVATGTVDPNTMAPRLVPLGQVAKIGPGLAPGEIKRLNLQRLARVEGNYEGTSLTKVMRDVRRQLAGLPLPSGYRIDIGGESQDFAETVGYILESLVLAITFIYLILASQFGSFLQPLAIMLSLPLSLVGVMFGLMFTRDTFNIISMIGIIMLMGLVTKNAILLVDFTNKARERGLDRRAALIDAGELRLRPIMMTTLAMIFGMMPTALALGDGGEMRAPMARAVIGGLITSTMLTLIVVPVVYTYLDDFGAKVSAWIHGWNTAPAEQREPEKEVEEVRVPEGLPAD